MKETPLGTQRYMCDGASNLARVRPLVGCLALGYTEGGSSADMPTQCQERKKGRVGIDKQMHKLPEPQCSYIPR